jgi:hypothetical protein
MGKLNLLASAPATGPTKPVEAQIRSIGAGDGALVGRNLDDVTGMPRVKAPLERKRPGVAEPWVLHGLERETGFEPATLSLGS